jgi:hypothetical protein
MSSQRKASTKLVPATSASSIGKKEGRALVRKTNIESPEPTRSETHLSAEQFPSDPVPPQPIKTVHLPYERAYQLATMPRNKWDEKTWSAFWATIASLSGAAEAIHDGLKSSPFSLGAFNAMQVLIFFGFLIWFIVSRSNLRSTKTSSEYLNELYDLPPPPSPTQWWQFWRS